MYVTSGRRLSLGRSLVVELHHIFVLLYAVTTVLSLAVSWVAWRRRAARGALSLAALMLGIAIWSAASAVMWYAPTLGGQVFWLGATFLGVWMVPVAVMRLALDIARVKRWRTPIIALLVTVSLAFLGIVWLNPGRLYNAAFVARTMGPYTHYDAVPGPLYLAYNVFAFVTIIAGLVIMLRVWLRPSGADRTQAGIVFAGGLVPLISSAVTESRLVSLSGLDLAPLAFLVTGSLWLVAILRGTLLEIVPVARDALVEQMLDGVVVLNCEGRVVDANPAALAMLCRPSSEVLGMRAEVVLGEMEGATALLGRGGPGRAVLKGCSGGDSREIELRITPLVVGSAKAPAQLITLRDVTELRQARERLELARTVFDTVNEGIVVTLPDPDQRVVDVNDAFCRLSGRSREDVVGTVLSSIQSDRHPPEFYEAIQRTLFSDGHWEGEVWQARADGTAFPSWLSLSVASDDEKQMRYAVGVLTDITQIKEAARLLESEGLYRALTEMTPDSVFVVDADMRLALANSPAARFVGRTVDQMKGARVAELFGPMGARLEDHLSRVTATGQSLESEECFTFGEADVWLKTSLVPLSDVAPGCVLGVSRDVTDSKRLEAALRVHANEEEHLASHDALTGLANRRAFMVALDRGLALARRGISSTVLFMDVDTFKRCNDERGHAFGDEVLISVARLLEKEVREVDLVARVGGDEFAALLAGSTEVDASVVAKRMRASVEALGADVGIPIGLSIGVAGLEEDTSAVHIIATADQRMYQDKAANSSARESSETT